MRDSLIMREHAYLQKVSLCGMHTCFLTEKELLVDVRQDLADLGAKHDP